MIRTILVPLDGSPFGEHAVPLACALARRCGAAMRLVHVHVVQEMTFGEPVLFTPPGVDEAIKQQRQQYLEGIASRVAACLGAAPTCAVLQGTVTTTLEKDVADSKADLVVMTTHGRGPLSRAWFGSVADDLMRRLSCPLVLVRPETDPADLAADVVPKRIVIALDGSALSEQILGPASDLAQACQAECILVRVMPPLIRGHADPNLTFSPLDAELLQKLEELHEQDHQEAEAYLQAKAKELQGRLSGAQARLVDNDQPAAALLHEAQQLDADLLALATHGRGGIPRLFLGSVADKVVRGAHCPILVFRPRHP